MNPKERKQLAEALFALYEVFGPYRRYNNLVEHLDSIKSECVADGLVDDDCEPK